MGQVEAQHYQLFFFGKQMKGCGSLRLPAASPVLKEPAVLTELRAGRTSDPIWTRWQRGASFCPAEA